MNLSLFRSKHGPLAIVLVLAFAGFSIAASAPWGRQVSHHRGFLLATGWAALLSMVVVMAYVLRKYAHRGGYSPEFRRKVDYASLEGAENRIKRLRQQINAGALPTAKEIESEAARILREEGVHKVNRALVKPGPPGGDPWIVRIVPTEPLGRVARWMHVHSAYGTAFGFFAIMHGGLSPQSPFGWTLLGLGLFVFVTGIIGIALWAVGPRWLTRREKDLSIEEATAFHASLGRKRSAALDSLDAPVAHRMRSLQGKRPRSAEETETLIRELSEDAPDQVATLQDLAALIAQERVLASEVKGLRRVRATFTAWKLVHIPVAVVLVGLVAVHVVSIWKY
jgi:hypothetical protein